MGKKKKGNKTKVIAIKKCHDKPTQVVKNLYCGKYSESLEMVFKLNVDTLIPLDSLDADIWDLGFRGEILYYPIEDYKTLPDDVINTLADKIIERIKNGKKVGLFCIGGHGRTGYVASIVLGKLGFNDPIKYVRDKYCHKAVETNAQIEHIAKILNKPKLKDYCKMYDDDIWGDYGDYSYSSVADYYKALGFKSSTHNCEDCFYMNDERCDIYQTQVQPDDCACDEFKNR